MKRIFVFVLLIGMFLYGPCLAEEQCQHGAGESSTEIFTPLEELLQARATLVESLVDALTEEEIAEINEQIAEIDEQIIELE